MRYRRAHGGSEDFGTNLTLVEGNGGVRLSPVSVPERAPRDGGHSVSGNGRGRTRPKRARKSCAGRKWPPAAMAVRGSLGSCRRRLSEALSPHGKGRAVLAGEVARLETLLSEAGIASAFDTAGALRKENARLRKALAASKAREGATSVARSAPRRTVLEPSPDQKETVRSLRLRRLDKEVVRRDKENARLNIDQEKERTERIRETAKKLSSESLRLHREVRILGDAEARARSLSDEVFWLRHALDKEKLKARLAKLRAAGATPKLPSDEAAQLRAVEAIAAANDDRGAAQGQRPSAQDRAEVGDPESGAGGSACQSRQEGTRVRACRVERSGRRCRSRPLQTPISAGLCEGRGARRFKFVPGERPPAQGRTSRNRIETRPLRGFDATGAGLSRALYGRKSEQRLLGTQARPAARRARPRPHQRPGLDERTEEHKPDACVCGQPYAEQRRGPSSRA